MITRGSVSIIPHQNWRGQFARGTYPNGTKSDCTSYPASGCTPIQWPGERTTARHELEKDGRIRNWFGGLVDGMRDASGQVYMRNRYYDPASGQFTQPDPIGLAGGLNAFGFANGDPVTYSDPYGLAGCDKKDQSDCSKSELIVLKVADRVSAWQPGVSAAFTVMQTLGPGGAVGAVTKVDDIARGYRYSRSSLRHLLRRHSPHVGPPLQGPGAGGKGTLFPAEWSNRDIAGAVLEVADNPANLVTERFNGAGELTGRLFQGDVTRNGVTARISIWADNPSKKILGTGEGVITTAYPTP